MDWLVTWAEQAEGLQISTVVDCCRQTQRIDAQVGFVGCGLREVEVQIGSSVIQKTPQQRWVWVLAGEDNSAALGWYKPQVHREP